MQLNNHYGSLTSKTFLNQLSVFGRHNIWTSLCSHYILQSGIAHLFLARSTFCVNGPQKNRSRTLISAEVNIGSVGCWAQKCLDMWAESFGNSSYGLEQVERPSLLQKTRAFLGSHFQSYYNILNVNSSGSLQKGQKVIFTIANKSPVC